MVFTVSRVKGSKGSEVGEQRPEVRCQRTPQLNTLEGNPSEIEKKKALHGVKMNRMGSLVGTDEHEHGILDLKREYKLILVAVARPNFMKIAPII